MPLNMHSIITPFLHLVHTVSRGHRLAHQNDVQIWWVVTDPLGAKGSKVTCMTLVQLWHCTVTDLWVIEFKGRGHLLVQRVPTQFNSQLPFTVQSILLGIHTCKPVLGIHTCKPVLGIHTCKPVLGIHMCKPVLGIHTCKPVLLKTHS